MEKKKIKLGVICMVLVLLASCAVFTGCTQRKQVNDINNDALVPDLNTNANKPSDNNTPKIYNNLDKNRMAKIGDTLLVHYMLWKGDMNYIQSTYEQNKPFEIVLGTTGLIPGFENALIGMKVGETKKIVLPQKDAYGEYDLNKVSTFDKNAFGADFNKMWIGRGIVHTMLGPGKIIKLNDSNAVIDFNPELAGQTLTFDINVVSIK